MRPGAPRCPRARGCRAGTSAARAIMRSASGVSNSTRLPARARAGFAAPILLRSPAMARASSSRARSYGSPVSGKPTVAPASENTRGTICCSRPLDEVREPEAAGERQVLVVLEAAAQVRELNRGDRPADAAVLIRMQLLLARIEQHAVAVDVALVVDRLSRLAAVVERDRVGPDVLVALALLLRVVLPVHGVPVEVHADVVLERGPDHRPRVGGRRVDRDGASGWAAAVVEPVLAPARPLLRARDRSGTRRPEHQMSIAGASASVYSWSRRPAARGPARGSSARCPASRRIRAILGRTRLVRHVQERQRARKRARQERHPGVGMRQALARSS